MAAAESLAGSICGRTIETSRSSRSRAAPSAPVGQISAGKPQETPRRGLFGRKPLRSNQLEERIGRNRRREARQASLAETGQPNSHGLCRWWFKAIIVAAGSSILWYSLRFRTAAGLGGERVLGVAPIVRTSARRGYKKGQEAARFGVNLRVFGLPTRHRGRRVRPKTNPGCPCFCGGEMGGERRWENLRRRMVV